jgi:hypothetical protein
MYPYPFIRERIRWSVSVPKFPGSGTLVRLSKKCWLQLILYVLNSKNLHNETISRNNLYEISRKYWYLKNLHNETISRNFAKESATKFREISRSKNHFRRYFVFREIKKILFRDHPSCTPTVAYTLPFGWYSAWHAVQLAFHANSVITVYAQHFKRGGGSPKTLHSNLFDPNTGRLRISTIYTEEKNYR